MNDNELNNLARDIWEHCRKMSWIGCQKCKYFKYCEKLKRIPSSYNSIKELFNALREAE